ncbi:hypothetical protein JW905_13115, partial [bacterium]|nr:hypothetical protein [candidate division CSSED10-310 bacterium]
GAGDLVEYYITVENSGASTTYLYGENAPGATGDEATAAAEPFSFAFPAYSPTPTIPPVIPAAGPGGWVLVMAALSGVIALSRRR